MDANKFKIGDIIIGKPEANKWYCVTREGWIGIVIDIVGNKQITVTEIGKKNTGVSFTVNTAYFENLKGFTAIQLANQLGFD